MPFFGHGPQVGPKVFLTDDSSAERNALELCWPEDSFMTRSIILIKKIGTYHEDDERNPLYKVGFRNAYALQTNVLWPVSSTTQTF
ncbi:7118_t:CDS:2 [Rhizophagus irregularis]|nr:7118_t:CDS:2 [Rhizophagus irregularis]